MKKERFPWHALYRFPTLYFAVWAVSALTWRFLPPNGISYTFTIIISLLFTLFELYSAARLFIVFEKRENLYQGEKTVKEQLRFLWKHSEVRLCLILFLLLPLPLPTFRPIFGALSPILRYLLSRLFIPFLFVAFFLGGLTGLVFHEQNEKKKELRKRINRSPLFFIFHVLKYVPLYTIAAYCLLAFTVVLVSLPGIAALILTSSLGGAVIITIAVLWIIRAIRGVRKRKRFLEQLKHACEMRGISTPKISEPIRSLFRRKERGTVFEITVGKRKYVCKLISALKPLSVYRFYPNGELGHVHVMFMRLVSHLGWGGILVRQRVELYEKKYNIGFEAEEGAGKIFIFNPCSKIVEGQFENSNVPLDNGMKVGEYTFYTATGFANALTRDCLHRRANE